MKKTLITRLLFFTWYYPGRTNALCRWRHWFCFLHLFFSVTCLEILVRSLISFTFYFLSLVEEQNNRLKDTTQQQGEESLIDSLLAEHGLCDILVPLLQSDDFYTKEKVLHAIQVSVHVCKDVYVQHMGGKSTGW